MSASSLDSDGGGSHPRPRRHRRQPHALLESFMVSAPGKVIVYGEHAVVHGKAAIAAAISLRSYLLVSFRAKDIRTVTLSFPDIELDHTWTIDDLPWKVFQKSGKKRRYYDLVTQLDPEFLEALKPHLVAVSPDHPESIRKIHHASALAFLYLFLSLGSSKSPPCVYTLRSTIPIGAGLGSSASIAVCLSASLLLQIRVLSGPHLDQPPDESAIQIERINRWAFVAEMCIHGNPSGVDNTVSAGGKAVLFQRKDYGKPPTVMPLRSFPELPLLLVNTRQSRSTAVEVAKVTALRKKHSEIAESILNAIDGVTREAHDLITREDFNPDDPASLKTLGELITVNHGLLVALGVSHPRLDRIREIIDHAGIGWTKLTGAGGGGCAITILKPTSVLALEAAEETQSSPAAMITATSVPTSTKPVSATSLAALESKLQSENYDLFATTLAGSGVGVLHPAVLHNGSAEDERGAGGEEIDQEKFLNAVGNLGIEELVGVARERKQHEMGDEGAVREGWKFWKC